MLKHQFLNQLSKSLSLLFLFNQFQAFIKLKPILYGFLAIVFMKEID
jgi:hypothetical protein